MKKVTVSTASLDELDWLAAKCEGVKVEGGLTADEHYTTEWRLAGPIMAHLILEGMALEFAQYDRLNPKARHRARMQPMGRTYRGATPLEATIRCYVARRLGEEVEVPERVVGVPA
jgi:hypothetical protein